MDWDAHELQGAGKPAFSPEALAFLDSSCPVPPQRVPSWMTLNQNPASLSLISSSSCGLPCKAIVGIERDVPLTAHSACAGQAPAVGACTQEPKERGQRWLAVCAAGISRHLLCGDRVMSLPQGVVTSPRRRQQCPQWEEAAIGALGHGVGVAPVSPPPVPLPARAKPRASGIGHPLRAQERDTAPRLTSGGHGQSCRQAAPGPRGVTAPAGAPRVLGGQPEHPGDFTPHNWRFCAAFKQGSSTLDGFCFLSRWYKAECYLRL